MATVLPSRPLRARSNPRRRSVVPLACQRHDAARRVPISGPVASSRSAGVSLVRKIALGAACHCVKLSLPAMRGDGKRRPDAAGATTNPAELYYSAPASCDDKTAAWATSGVKTDAPARQSNRVVVAETLSSPASVRQTVPRFMDTLIFCWRIEASQHMMPHRSRSLSTSAGS